MCVRRSIALWAQKALLETKTKNVRIYQYTLAPECTATTKKQSSLISWLSLELLCLKNGHQEKLLSRTTRTTSRRTRLWTSGTGPKSGPRTPWLVACRSQGGNHATRCRREGSLERRRDHGFPGNQKARDRARLRTGCKILGKSRCPSARRRSAVFVVLCGWVLFSSKKRLIVMIG